MKYSTQLIFLLLLSTFSSGLLFAESTLKILAEGEDGFGVPNVTLTLTGPVGPSSLTRTDISDSLGIVHFVKVPAGSYHLKTESLLHPTEVDITTNDDAGDSTLIFEIAGSSDEGPPKVLNTKTFPYSELASNIPQYRSDIWPELSNICSTRIDPQNRVIRLADMLLSPTQIVILNLNCPEPSTSRIFYPTVTLEFEMVQGAHTFHYYNGSIYPTDSERVTRNLTTVHPGINSPTVTSMNIIEGQSKEFFITSKLSNFQFQYQTSDCLNSDSLPETDLSKIRKGVCSIKKADGRIQGFKEDIMSVSKDSGGETIVTVRYQTKEVWLVVTANDGTAPVSDSIVALRLELISSGKTGNPIFLKNVFNSTADPFLVPNNDFSVLFPLGAPPKSIGYFQMSPGLVKRLTIDGISPPAKYTFDFLTNEQSFHSLLASNLSRNNDSAPTFEAITWHGLPWPLSTPVTISNILAPEATEAQIQVVNQSEGTPSGRFSEFIHELAANSAQLGSSVLSERELLRIIQDASSASPTNATKLKR
jgi:hypothetical protein